MRIKFHRQARSAPDSIDGLKVPYAAAKRNAPKWRWRLILLAVLSPAILLVYGVLKSALTLSANGTVFLEQYELRAPASGRVADLASRLGAEVRKGDVLVRLEQPTAQAAVKAKAIALPESRGNATSRHWLKQELVLQERSLRTHTERATSIEELVREGAATAAELREARLAVDQAQAAVLRTQQQLAAAEGGSLATRVAEPQAVLDSDRSLVRALRNGRVLDVMTAQGQFVTPGEPLLLIGTQADPSVIAYVSPEIAPQLTVGSKATIKFPDGTRAQATVTEQPMLTRRMPADLVDQFGLRPMTVVLHLQASREWPESQRIHGLPVTVRFHYAWEPW